MTPHDGHAPDQPIESARATQGADPDLSRDDPPGHAPTVREASTEELQEPSTEKDPDEVPTAPAAPQGEPSHEAVGIGVIDDDASVTEAGAQAEPAVRSQGDASQDDNSGPAATAADAPQPSAGSMTQDAPAMDQHETSVDDKIAGIVLQTQADVDSEGVTDIAGVLAQRLADAHITVSPDRLQELVHAVTRR